MDVKVADPQITTGEKKKRNHWVRIVMDRETEKLARGLGPEKLDALEISGDQWSAFGFKSYRVVGYPDFDICARPETWDKSLADSLTESADLVLAEQVWEHLTYPYRATRNVLSILRPGGYFLLSTPFLIKVHHGKNYGDCSRWTKDGMRHFLEECGFHPSRIQTWSWGNLACTKANLENERWPRFGRGMDLGNEPTFPVQVWALAQKE